MDTNTLLQNFARNKQEHAFIPNVDLASTSLAQRLLSWKKEPISGLKGVVPNFAVPRIESITLFLVSATSLVVNGVIDTANTAWAGFTFVYLTARHPLDSAWAAYQNIFNSKNLSPFVITRLFAAAVRFEQKYFMVTNHCVVRVLSGILNPLGLFSPTAFAERMQAPSELFLLDTLKAWLNGNPPNMGPAQFVLVGPYFNLNPSGLIKAVDFFMQKIVAADHSDKAVALINNLDAFVRRCTQTHIAQQHIEAQAQSLFLKIARGPLAHETQKSVVLFKLQTSGWLPSVASCIEALTNLPAEITPRWSNTQKGAVAPQLVDLLKLYLLEVNHPQAKTSCEQTQELVSRLGKYFLALSSADTKNLISTNPLGELPVDEFLSALRHLHHGFGASPKTADLRAALELLKTVQLSQIAAPTARDMHFMWTHVQAEARTPDNIKAVMASAKRLQSDQLFARVDKQPLIVDLFDFFGQNATSGDQLDYNRLFDPEQLAITAFTLPSITLQGFAFYLSRLISPGYTLTSTGNAKAWVLLDRATTHFAKGSTTDAEKAAFKAALSQLANALTQQTQYAEKMSHSWLGAEDLNKQVPKFTAQIVSNLCERLIALEMFDVDTIGIITKLFQRSFLKLQKDNLISYTYLDRMIETLNTLISKSPNFKNNAALAPAKDLLQNCIVCRLNNLLNKEGFLRVGYNLSYLNNLLASAQLIYPLKLPTAFSTKQGLWYALLITPAADTAEVRRTMALLPALYANFNDQLIDINAALAQIRRWAGFEKAEFPNLAPILAGFIDRELDASQPPVQDYVRHIRAIADAKGEPLSLALLAMPSVQKIIADQVKTEEAAARQSKPTAPASPAVKTDLKEHPPTSTHDALASPSPTSQANSPLPSTPQPPTPLPTSPSAVSPTHPTTPPSSPAPIPPPAPHTSSSSATASVSASSESQPATTSSTAPSAPPAPTAEAPAHPILHLNTAVSTPALTPSSGPLTTPGTAISTASASSDESPSLGKTIINSAVSFTGGGMLQTPTPGPTPTPAPQQTPASASAISSSPAPSIKEEAAAPTYSYEGAIDTLFQADGQSNAVWTLGFLNNLVTKTVASLNGDVKQITATFTEERRQKLWKAVFLAPKADSSIGALINTLIDLYPENTQGDWGKDIIVGLEALMESSEFNSNQLPNLVELLTHTFPNPLPVDAADAQRLYELIQTIAENKPALAADLKALPSLTTFVAEAKMAEAKAAAAANIALAEAERLRKEEEAEQKRREEEIAAKIKADNETRQRADSSTSSNGPPLPSAHTNLSPPPSISATASPAPAPSAPSSPAPTLPTTLDVSPNGTVALNSSGSQFSPAPNGINGGLGLPPDLFTPPPSSSAPTTPVSKSKKQDSPGQATDVKAISNHEVKPLVDLNSPQAVYTALKQLIIDFTICHFAVNLREELLSITTLEATRIRNQETLATLVQQNPKFSSIWSEKLANLNQAGEDKTKTETAKARLAKASFTAADLLEKYTKNTELQWKALVLQYVTNLEKIEISGLSFNGSARKGRKHKERLATLKALGAASTAVTLKEIQPVYEGIIDSLAEFVSATEQRYQTTRPKSSPPRTPPQPPSNPNLLTPPSSATSTGSLTLPTPSSVPNLGSTPVGSINGGKSIFTSPAVSPLTPSLSDKGSPAPPILIPPPDLPRTSASTTTSASSAT